MPPTPPTERPPASARRPYQLIPGGWVVLALLLVAAVVLLVIDNSTRTVTFSEFQKLSESGQVKKLTIIGKERAVGEVRDPNGELAKAFKVSGGKFAVNLPYTDNQFDLIKSIETQDEKAR